MPVTTLDGAVIDCRYKGELHLRLRLHGSTNTTAVVVKDVYYHESVTANLLSLGALEEAGWAMNIETGNRRLVTPRRKRVQLSKSGNLYMVRHIAPQSAAHAHAA